MNAVLWVLGVVIGSLVSIIVLVLLIGFLLPSKYKVSASVPIEKDGQVTAKTVWERLDDVENYPMCGGMCRGVTIVKKVKGNR
mmetsp:Transcript_1117/g.1638  ORF Transcript_1117/g.1638 Transcript_1117/m.1638 type:complete len:83 (+) Transcript_1117:205-453(+)